MLIDRTRAAMAMFAARFSECRSTGLRAGGRRRRERRDPRGARSALRSAKAFRQKYPRPGFARTMPRWSPGRGLNVASWACSTRLGVAPKARWPLQDAPARGEPGAQAVLRATLMSVANSVKDRSLPRRAMAAENAAERMPLKRLDAPGVDEDCIGHDCLSLLIPRVGRPFGAC